MRYLTALITAFFLSIGLCSPVQAAISILQRAHNSFGSASTTLSTSFTGGITAGSIIVVSGMFDDTAATSVTISDGHSDTVSTVLAPVNNTGIPAYIFSYVILAPTTGTITITATYNGSCAYGDLFIWEIAGLTSPALDKIVSASGTGTAASSGATGTLSAANEAAIMYGSSASNYSGAVGSGWTNAAVSTITADVGAEQVVATNASITGSATVDANVAWTMLAATFMSGGAPPPGGVTKRSLTGVGQ